MEKSGNWIVVRENGKSHGKVRESYNHHLAAEREKDIIAFLRYQSRLLVCKIMIITVVMKTA